jgi:hypothetical protein
LSQKQEVAMAATLAQALQTAWSIYLIQNDGVHPSDSKRCILKRYMELRIQVGDTDVEDLAVDGLAYLRKLDYLQQFS